MSHFYRRFDQDDSKIRCFAYIVLTFWPRSVEDMIKEVDVDGDGRIDFYEFVHALGEPEDSQENEDDDEPFSPLPKAITCADGDDSLSQ